MAAHLEHGTSPIDRIASALAAGGVIWIVAALVGGDDGTGRFYASEVLWTVAQLLLVVGTVGLVRSLRGSVGRVGRAGGVIAIVGRVAFVVAEVAALATGELQDALLPPAALATALGSLLLGLAVARARCWGTLPTVLALLVGAYPVFAMFPFAAAADGPPVASLVGWGIVTAWFGASLRTAEVRTPAFATAS